MNIGIVLNVMSYVMVDLIYKLLELKHEDQQIRLLSNKTNHELESLYVACRELSFDPDINTASIDEDLISLAELAQDIHDSIY
jgi:hypothetical protein